MLAIRKARLHAQAWGFDREIPDAYDSAHGADTTGDDLALVELDHHYRSRLSLSRPSDSRLPGLGRAGLCPGKKASWLMIDTGVTSICED